MTQKLDEIVVTEVKKNEDINKANVVDVSEVVPAGCPMPAKKPHYVPQDEPKDEKSTVVIADKVVINE